MRMKNYFIRTGIRLVSNLSKSIGQYANVAIGSEVSFVKSVVYYFTRRRIKVILVFDIGGSVITSGLLVILISS